MKFKKEIITLFYKLKKKCHEKFYYLFVEKETPGKKTKKEDKKRAKCPTIVDQKSS